MNQYKIEIINKNINYDFLCKLIDFIAYLNNEETNFYLDKEIFNKNQYYTMILDNIQEKDKFLDLFIMYKILELEKTGNFNNNFVFNNKMNMLFINIDKIIGTFFGLYFNFFNTKIANRSNYFINFLRTRVPYINTQLPLPMSNYFINLKEY